MAYTPRNQLLFMQDVIDAYLAAKTEDKTVKDVYNEVIFPRFRISRATMYNYLATPVKRLLKELDEKERTNGALKLDL